MSCRRWVLVAFELASGARVSWPVSQDQRTRRGYLLLADISGYTAFLVGTELEHADAIVHELTALIRERLSPPMRFVKLEGDAVFCYADETIVRGW